MLKNALKIATIIMLFGAVNAEAQLNFSRKFSVDTLQTLNNAQISILPRAKFHMQAYLDTLSSFTASSSVLLNDTLRVTGYTHTDNIQSNTASSVVTVNDSLTVTGHITGQNYFSISGTTGASPFTTSGQTYFGWVPATKTLVGGTQVSDPWSSLGNYSVILGYQVDAANDSSFVWGSRSTIGNVKNNISMGWGNSNAISTYSAQFGSNNVMSSGNNHTNIYQLGTSNSFSPSSSSRDNAFMLGTNNTAKNSDQFLFGDNLTASGIATHMMGANLYSAQQSVFVWGLANTVDTSNYGHIAQTRNLPFGNFNRYDTSANSSASIWVMHEQSADTSIWGMQAIKPTGGWMTGYTDFNLQKGWGITAGTFGVTNYLNWLHVDGSDNGIHFNYSKSGGSYGNVYVDNGNFVLSGTASNIALGSNYISNGGTDAGLSLDGSNNATFSGSATVGTSLTITHASNPYWLLNETGGTARAWYGQVVSDQFLLTLGGVGDALTVGTDLSLSVSGSGTFGGAGTFTVSSGYNLVLNKGTGPALQFNKTAATAQSWALFGEENTFYLRDETAAITPVSFAKATGNATFSGSLTSQSYYALTGSAGTSRDFAYQTGGVNRWIVRTSSDAESGSDAGSNFQILSRTDAGAAKTTVVTINRASGLVTLANALSVSGSVTVGGLTSEGGLGVTVANDTLSWTGRAASISSQNFSNTATGKLYEITYYVHTTTTGTGTVTFNLAWNDGTAKTFASATCDLTSTGNAGMVYGVEVIYVSSGTPSWSTTVAGGGSTEQYAVRGVIKRLW